MERIILPNVSYFMQESDTVFLTPTFCHSSVEAGEFQSVTPQREKQGVERVTQARTT